jgi:hypothetical protein
MLVVVSSIPLSPKISNVNCKVSEEGIYFADFRN